MTDLMCRPRYVLRVPKLWESQQKSFSILPLERVALFGMMYPARPTPQPDRV